MLVLSTIHLIYADDAVLFTEDATKWDDVLHKFEASSSVISLHTNWLKTKIQNIGTGDTPTIVYIDNQADPSSPRPILEL